MNDICLSRRSMVGFAAFGAAFAGAFNGVAFRARAFADAPASDALTVCLPSAISTLDPIGCSNKYEAQVACQITDRLVEYDDALEQFVPSLAAEWSVSEDGLAYVFTLRDGVRFQNGIYAKKRMLNPEDVVYSLERAHTSDTTAILPLLSSVSVTGEHEITCLLERPDSSFLASLTDAACSIIAKEEVEGWGKDFSSHLVGTGPFALGSQITDDGVSLTANPDYFLGKPSISSIYFVVSASSRQAAEALMGGKADLAIDLEGAAIEAIRSSDTVSLLEIPALHVDCFLFNQNDGAMSDPRVRKALIEAVDYDVISASLFQHDEAVPACLPLPYASWGYDSQLESLFCGYDPIDAKDLLVQAGLSDGCDISICTKTGQEDTILALILKAYWDSLGLNTEVVFENDSSFDDAVATGSASVYITHFDGNPDPASLLGRLVATAQRLGYANGDVDSLLDAALNTTPQDERKAIYAEALEAIMGDYAGAYYANPKLLYGISPRVEGFAQRADGSLRFMTSERATSLTR